VRLPPFLREALDDTATILFLGFLVCTTWELLPRTFSRYPATGWPVKVGYYAIVVGGVLTILATLAKHVLRRLR
jgi:TRAP-type C4-dicarboxylate transport system permease small subunit